MGAQDITDKSHPVGISERADAPGWPSTVGDVIDSRAVSDVSERPTNTSKPIAKYCVIDRIAMGVVRIEVKTVVTFEENVMRPHEVRTVETAFDPPRISRDKPIVSVIVSVDRTRTAVVGDHHFVGLHDNVVLDQNFGGGAFKSHGITAAARHAPGSLMDVRIAQYTAKSGLELNAVSEPKSHFNILCPGIGSVLENDSAARTAGRSEAFDACVGHGPIVITRQLRDVRNTVVDMQRRTEGNNVADDARDLLGFSRWAILAREPRRRFAARGFWMARSWGDGRQWVVRASWIMEIPRHPVIGRCIYLPRPLAVRLPARARKFVQQHDLPRSKPGRVGERDG